MSIFFIVFALLASWCESGFDWSTCCVGRVRSKHGGRASGVVAVCRVRVVLLVY